MSSYLKRDELSLGVSYSKHKHETAKWIAGMKPYALLTITSNHSGLYGKSFSEEFKKNKLLRDVRSIFLSWEKAFWNVHNPFGEVHFNDRFHGIGVVEGLETNPHVHIILFFHPQNTFSSELARIKEIERRMRFLVWKYKLSLSADTIRLEVRDEKYLDMDVPLEWKFLSHFKTGKVTRPRFDGLGKYLPGGDMHIKSFGIGFENAYQASKYILKKEDTRTNENVFFLEDFIGVNRNLNPTAVPLLGVDETS